MKKFTQILIENINQNEKANILVIVDVQENFSKFIPKDFIKNLIEYSKNFSTVIQIWDSHDANAPSYKFANQKGIYIKKFGTKFSEKLENTIKILDKKYPNVKEGFKIKLVDINKNSDSVEEIQSEVQGQTDNDEFTNAYVVRINNRHRWFFVTTKLANLFQKLNGKNVELVGGAYRECETDIFVAMKSFGVNVYENFSYIYSAKNNNQQLHDPKTQSQTL